PILLEKGASYAAEDHAAVKQAIQNKIKTKSLAEWQMLFAALDVCVEPVLKLEEALRSDLAQQRGWVVQVPLKSKSPQNDAHLSCAIKFSRAPIRYEFVGQQLGESQNW